MTLWAKVLVVIILVLSLVFAGMSAVIFAKRQDYRSTLQRERDTFEATKTNLENQVKGFRADLQAKQAEVERMNTALNGATEQVGTLTNDLKKQTGQLTDLQATVAREQENVNKQALALQTLTASETALTKKNNELREENIAYNEKLAAANKKNNELSEMNARLTNDKELLTKDLSTAKATIGLNEEIFARLKERNIEAATVLAALNAMPDVKAKVVTVDGDTNMIVLNAGKNQKVQKNFEFTIWREGNFVAKANVFDVQDDLCAARIVTRKLPVQRGDNAWTRMQ